MFALNRRKSATTKVDPAPSRWSWRMQRLMLTPAFRLGLRAGVPFCLTLMVGTIYLADDARRSAILDRLSALRASIETRPEFMVKLMAVDGAEGALAAQIRAAVPEEFPISSFDLDLSVLRETVTALDGVKSASVRIKPGGVLHVDVIKREATALWRTQDGLVLIDNSGTRVAHAVSRAEHPHLPLIAGEGADAHVPEALILMTAASGLGERLRGLVRMGDRRWDVVLDRDQRIMLPETNALQALERVVALENVHEVLTRDVARVDMRLSKRPTVQMTQEATQEWWQIKTLSGQ